MAFRLLEEALSSSAGPSRKNELRWTFISTVTPIPAANIHVDYNGDAPIAIVPSHHAGGSGHREDCQHDKDEGSVFMKLVKQGMLGVGVGRGSHSEYLDFLSTNGPTFLTQSLDDKHEISSVLLMMADNVKRAQAPADSAEQPEWDMLDMRMWYVLLCELMKEMKMVQEHTPSSVIDDKSGAYVITSSPYDAFLRALAAEVADRSAG